MDKQFARTEKIIGPNGIEKLKESSVLVLGAGGVGSYALEALARAGVGRIGIVDDDVVDETNINRQIIALHSTVGLSKVCVAQERILDINPNATVKTYKLFFDKNASADMDFTEYDYVIDAVDTVAAKIEIALKCKDQNVSLISVMGTGNKVRSNAFRVSDINKTGVCPLAKAVRRELRRQGIDKLTVVYSEEEPVRTGERTPSSISFVPGAAGLLAAEYVIMQLINK